MPDCSSIEFATACWRPEIDRAEFFDAATATRKIIAAQAALIDELAAILSRRGQGT